MPDDEPFAVVDVRGLTLSTLASMFGKRSTPKNGPPGTYSGFVSITNLSMH
jgi:hypothetical protein